ncbi:MAG: Smr/MutS family protein [Rhodospirillales bacterium]|nr:Smr/MutS family protein [Alphaproteobacteria bacterium]USO04098.1 MAG: Smr/MutS family protein [Rhodospirillales bacterium]
MSGSGKGKGGGMDDFQLWKSFARDIDPLEDVDWDAQEEALRRRHGKREEVQEEGGRTTPVFNPQQSSPRQAEKGDSQLDRRTEERLRQGKLSIEGRLDLHGYRQDDAKSALVAFIQNAQAEGRRCVLVITGKGAPEEPAADWTTSPRGILRRRVPEWLSERPLSNIVLKTVPAQKKDGGEGALYVYLRRERDYSS